jgi:hypothetical protein
LIPEPEFVPFDGNVLGTAKGTWVIRVDTAAYVPGTDSILLNVTLRGVVGSELGPETRRLLSMLVPAPVLKDLHMREDLAYDMRGWIEATDGNGFLDLRTAE